MEPLEVIIQMFTANPLFIVFLVIGLMITIFAPVIKGKIGEGTVNLTAKLRLDPNEYTLLKDVTIPTKLGTTQIDHIILSRFGIFVIEAKNYSGWIFGSAEQKTWT